MKNKKIRLISVMLLITQVISLFYAVSVAAAPTVEINVTKCEIKGKSLFVGGETLSGGSAVSTDVSVVVYKQGSAYMGSDTKYVDDIKSDAEGRFSREIKLYDSENAKQLYILDVAFDNPDATERIVKSVQYANDRQIDYSISRLKNSPDMFVYMTGADSPVMICKIPATVFCRLPLKTVLCR